MCSQLKKFGLIIWLLKRLKNLIEIELLKTNLNSLNMTFNNEDLIKITNLSSLYPYTLECLLLILLHWIVSRNGHVVTCVYV